MIEQGLVMLIQAGLGSPSPIPGFATELPKDYIQQTIPAAGNGGPKAWTYRTIEAEPSYFLNGQDGFTGLHLQIDCYGYAMLDAIALARAIESALRDGAPPKFPGVLPDNDHTFVQGIFRLDPFIDGFSDVNRSFVRTMEYLVNYNQV